MTISIFMVLDFESFDSNDSGIISLKAQHQIKLRFWTLIVFMKLVGSTKWLRVQK